MALKDNEMDNASELVTVYIDSDELYPYYTFAFKGHQPANVPITKISEWERIHNEFGKMQAELKAIGYPGD